MISVPAMGVVAETMVALVLASEALQVRATRWPSCAQRRRLRGHAAHG